MTLVMPAAVQNAGSTGQHGPEVDEAKERKRLQNRIAQRKFRERKAQQQMLANAAAANTAAASSKPFPDMDMNSVPPEVLPWIGKMYPYSNLPGAPAPSLLNGTTTAPPVKLEDQASDMSRESSKNFDCFPCNKCGRRLFSILGDACICTMPTPQTPTRSLSNHQIKDPLADHSGLTPPGDLSSLLKSSPRDDEFPFDMSGFQTPVSMNMSSDLLQATPFLSERGNSLPLLPLSRHGSLPNYPMSAPSSVPGSTKSIMSFFPDDNSHNSMSAMVSQTVSRAQEINAPLLHVAVFNGNCKIIKMLIEHQYDINEQDQYGNTALHVAVRSRNESIVNFLLRHGANANLRDQDGQSPLHLAVQTGFENAVGMLLAHSSVRSSPS